MAREDLHFRLRIPEDLKKQVHDAAEKYGRSMTAEIIQRLAWTFDGGFYNDFGPDGIKPETPKRVVITGLHKLRKELETLETALHAEHGMLMEATDYAEDFESLEDAKDAAELAETRIGQLERRIARVRKQIEAEMLREQNLPNPFDDNSEASQD
ncbi:MAG: Arc family DNA-binding protein [Komagataeibacter saccharivorans]|uniref:Arc family DNA-binding protein n=1 Tax=Komagataeibacter saccharivorans TaxID=265959 RepID=UPI0039EAFCF0